MHLESHYTYKNNLYLAEKIFNQYKIKIYSKINFLNFEIRYIAKKNKWIFILLFLLLTFFSTLVFNYKRKWIISIIYNYEIFIFINNFILFWLPTRIQNEPNNFNNVHGLNNLVYSFKAFPVIIEIEKLTEFNSCYYEILKQIKSKLTINTQFINIIHKESFSHFFKIPLQLNYYESYKN
jgi:hypothetical protein